MSIDGLFDNEPRMLAEPGKPSYARVDRAPAWGPDGLLIEVMVEARNPVSARGDAQVILACAEHAAGWSLGLDRHGRPSLVVGTQSGPVGVNTGEPLGAARRYRLTARIPGRPGSLELTARAADADASEQGRVGRVLVGAPVIASRGPLLWGCRSLFDGERPELPFDGVVGHVRIVGDSHAGVETRRPDDAAVASVVWDLEVAVGGPVVM